MWDKILIWPLFTMLLTLFLMFWFAIGAFRLLARLLDRWSLGGL